MKHPDGVRKTLKNQWKNTNIREERLLSDKSWLAMDNTVKASLSNSVWPLEMPIKLPSPRSIESDISSVKVYLDSWRDVRDSGVGKIVWKEKNYKALGRAQSFPVAWQLENINDWINACNSQEVEGEFIHLEQIIEQIDPCFYSTVIRYKSVILKKSVEEVVLAANVALALEPGYAEGKPLRALSVEGCDSKFFERNEWLLKQFLSVRFGDTVLDLGLEKFLDASKDGEHWLLVIPLGPGLLPFKQQKVRTIDLIETPLAACNILIVENFECVFQLPALPDTIVILGAGKDLSWLAATWLKEKNVAYWGDLDTWGLDMLSTVRKHLPQLTPLMMEQSIFDLYATGKAVVEPTRATEKPPAGLTESEVELYRYLYSQEKGRLEQEFLPQEFAARCIEEWWKGLSFSSKA